MTTPNGDRGYIHEALFFSGAEELKASAGPFLRPGERSAESVVMVVSDETASALTSGLNGEHVVVLDRRDVYARPSRALEAYRTIAETELAAGAHRVRLLGQIDFGNHPRSWAHWAAFEAACNRVLEGYPLWNLCLYDVDHLPADVLQAGRRTHPRLIGRSDGAYLSPEYLLDTLAAAHPTPFADEPSLEVGSVGSAGQARAVLRRYLEKAAVGATPAVEDLVGAVSELVANALTHGQPPVTLRLWVTADYVHCAVVDAGPGFVEPLAGYTKA